MKPKKDLNWIGSLFMLLLLIGGFILVSELVDKRNAERPEPIHREYTVEEMKELDKNEEEWDEIRQWNSIYY